MTPDECEDCVRELAADELRVQLTAAKRIAECPECGRLWFPSMLESGSFLGSACDIGECICMQCEIGEDCPRHNGR